MKTSIYLIEDDVEFAKGLQKLLAASPLLHVAGHASNLATARLHIESQANDIYLVDITLPDGSGLEIMKEIQQRHPQSKIMALSTLGDEKHILGSIQAGALGYLLKSEMPANIIQSIVSLINDGGYLSGHASKVLIRKLNTLLPDPLHTAQPTNLPEKIDGLRVISRPSVLTRKEVQILCNAESGAQAKAIAETLCISIFTVNQHLRSIYRKLNVRNKMAAVQSARHQGLI